MLYPMIALGEGYCEESQPRSSTTTTTVCSSSSRKSGMYIRILHRLLVVSVVLSIRAFSVVVVCFEVRNIEKCGSLGVD